MKGKYFDFFKLILCLVLQKFGCASVESCICEDGRDRIGCCKISLVFILGYPLTNIYAPN